MPEVHALQMLLRILGQKTDKTLVCVLAEEKDSTIENLREALTHCVLRAARA